MSLSFRPLSRCRSRSLSDLLDHDLNQNADLMPKNISIATVASVEGCSQDGNTCKTTKSISSASCSSDTLQLVDIEAGAEFPTFLDHLSVDPVGSVHRSEDSSVEAAVQEAKSISNLRRRAKSDLSSYSSSWMPRSMRFSIQSGMCNEDIGAPAISVPSITSHLTPHGVSVEADPHTGIIPCAAPMLSPSSIDAHTNTLSLQSTPPLSAANLAAASSIATGSGHQAWSWAWGYLPVKSKSWGNLTLNMSLGSKKADMQVEVGDGVTAKGLEQPAGAGVVCVGASEDTEGMASKLRGEGELKHERIYSGAAEVPPTDIGKYETVDSANQVEKHELQTEVEADVDKLHFNSSSNVFLPISAADAGENAEFAAMHLAMASPHSIDTSEASEAWRLFMAREKRLSLCGHILAQESDAPEPPPTGPRSLRALILRYSVHESDVSQVQDDQVAVVVVLGDFLLSLAVAAEVAARSSASQTVEEVQRQQDSLELTKDLVRTIVEDITNPTAVSPVAGRMPSWVGRKISSWQADPVALGPRTLLGSPLTGSRQLMSATAAADDSLIGHGDDISGFHDQVRAASGRSRRKLLGRSRSTRSTSSKSTDGLDVTDSPSAYVKDWKSVVSVSGLEECVDTSFFPEDGGEKIVVVVGGSGTEVDVGKAHSQRPRVGSRTELTPLSPSAGSEAASGDEHVVVGVDLGWESESGSSWDHDTPKALEDSIGYGVSGRGSANEDEIVSRLRQSGRGKADPPTIASGHRGEERGGVGGGGGAWQMDIADLGDIDTTFSLYRRPAKDGRGSHAELLRAFVSPPASVSPQSDVLRSHSSSLSPSNAVTKSSSLPVPLDHTLEVGLSISTFSTSLESVSAVAGLPISSPSRATAVGAAGANAGTEVGEYPLQGYTEGANIGAAHKSAVDNSTAKDTYISSQQMPTAEQSPGIIDSGAPPEAIWPTAQSSAIPASPALKSATAASPTAAHLGASLASPLAPARISSMAAVSTTTTTAAAAVPERQLTAAASLPSQMQKSGSAVVASSKTGEEDYAEGDTDPDNLSLEEIPFDAISPEPPGGDFYDSGMRILVQSLRAC